MHSLSMAEGILQAAIDEARNYNAKNIKAINVKVTDEHYAESDSLQFCLEAMAKGTIAEGAAVEIEHVVGEQTPLVTIDID